MWYAWNNERGIVDADTKQQKLQLIGGTNKFRKMAGKELVNKLNSIEQGKWLARLKYEDAVKEGKEGEE